MITLDQNAFRTQTACPLCHGQTGTRLGRPRFQRLYESPRDLVELTETVDRGRELMRCEGCGLMYNRLIPKNETLDFLYDVPTGEPTWKFDPRRRLMQEKLQFLTKLPRQGRIRVLDVGCYAGGFLEMLPANWIKFGVDPNSEALNVARRRIPDGRFLQGQLNACDSLKGTFDLITLWDVAEHLDDVDTAFRRLAALLAPGGVLAMETGDADSAVARGMGAAWYYVNCLEHFCVFDEDVFRNVLPRYGLEVVFCKRTTHHRYTGMQAMTSRLQFWSYYAMTLGGCVSAGWRALSKGLGRKGTPYPPAARDHIFVLARKV